MSCCDLKNFSPMLVVLLMRWYDTWISFQSIGFWLVMQRVLSPLHVISFEFVVLVSDTNEFEKN